MKLRIIIPAIDCRTVLRYFFLAVAVVCLGLYGYAYLERVLYQTYESREFDRATDRSAALAASKPSTGRSALVGQTSRSAADVLVGLLQASTSAGPGGPPHNGTLSLGRRTPNALIGRLSVPRLHLSAMVREGVDGNTLQLAVGHVPATALPGQPGNVGVAGHRDTFFRGLKDLRTRDEIQFSTSSGDFKYVVESLIIVEPDNVEVLAASSGHLLTMVTCYPFTYIGSAPKRFVVRARQVSPSTVE